MSNNVTVIQDQPTQLMAIIAKAASDPSVDVAKMAALLDLQERVVAKQAKASFTQSLTELMRELPRITKDGAVAYPVDKNRPDGEKKEAFRFATWENIDKCIRPLLEKHGFCLSFNSTPKEGGGAIITGTLMHRDGHSESASIPLALDTSGGKNNIQAMGSTYSYGKRYTTCMLLNIVTEGEDDDAKRGGAVYIDDTKRDIIFRLLEETSTDAKDFCDFMGVESLPEIEVKDYTRAVNALMTKKKKAGAK